MKSLSDKKELIKEDFKDLLQEQELKKYLSLIDDDRFDLFESFDEDNLIKLKSDKDVIVIPKITLKIDKNGDEKYLLDGYIITIELNFNDLIEAYESKYEGIDYTELLDEFLVYLYSNNVIIDFKGIPQLYDYRQFLSYEIDLKEINSDNYIESIYKSINKHIEYQDKSLTSIYKKLPKFEA